MTRPHGVEVLQGHLADIEAEIKKILSGFLKDPPPLTSATDLIADLRELVRSD